jgi:hypothetical protein
LSRPYAPPVNRGNSRGSGSQRSGLTGIFQPSSSGSPFLLRGTGLEQVYEQIQDETRRRNTIIFPMDPGQGIRRESDPSPAAQLVPVTTEVDLYHRYNDTGRLYIPLPRTGQPQSRRNPNPRVPDPNSCVIPEHCPNPLPFFIETRALPEHYTLVSTAISRDRQPALLIRGGALGEINRTFTSGYFKQTFGPATNYSRSGEKAEWDEYPYASTLQGGFGATVGAVKATENNQAGINLNNFYTTRRVLPGCPFVVLLS